MNRRDILKYTALVTGAAVSAPLASALLSSCQSGIAADDIDYELKFFDEEQFALVRQLVDVILPKTDSPSASEVKVHQMIDQFLGEVHVKEEQDNYRTAFSKFSQYLKADDFMKQEVAEQQKRLLQVDDAEEGVRKTFMNFKQTTIAYYLTTEEIGTNYLNYLPIPGEYQGCISLEEVGGKAWAL
ncbi:MAG: gluconate 2-dehydrogenase subunit 3 family protein [Bacteroidota bacterium]